MNWEITSREHDDLEGWYERQESKRQEEVERFREVRPARDPRNESAIMGAFVIGCLIWIPLVIWALVTK